MNNTDEWEIDRKPSKKEKIFGVFLSGIFCIFSMAIFSGSAMILYKEGINKVNLIFMSVSLFLLLFSLYLLFRFLCTPPKPPSKVVVKIVPYILIGEGMLLITLSFLAKENPFTPLSFGLMALSGGITMLLNRTKLRKNT